jgi:predicted  nucleic acid-binding Zn-ribbon protein
MTEDWDPRPAPERVSALGRNAITEMLDALPAKDLEFCLRQFAPKQKGFRPGHSPPALAKRQLASALTTHVPKENSPEWHAYAHAWRDFTEAQFGDAWLDAHRILEANGEADPALIERVQAAVASKRFSREELLQALRLAPITVDSRALDVAGSAPLQTDVDARRLDDDIEDMKNDLMSFDAELTKLVARVEVIERLDPVSTKKLDERLSAASGTVAKELAALKRDLTAFEERFKATATAVSATPAKLVALEGMISDLNNRVKAGAVELTTLQKALPRIAAIEQANEEAGLADVSRMRITVAEFEALGIELLERIDNLERRGGQIVATPSAAPHESRPLKLDWLQRAAETQLLTTVKDLASAIEDALDLVGVREASAALVAKEMAAAVACGQWVIVRGSCATEVSEVIAAALHPNAVQIVASAASLAPISLPQSSEPRVLVFEGINRVALEVVARELRVNAIREQLGLARSLDVVFAVCTDGATSLPIGMELLELGPIVDVDALDWRSAVDSRPLGAASLVLGTVDTSPLSLHDFEDHELKTIVGRETRVWRLGVARWLGTLHRLGASSADLRAALVCDWVLPLTALANPDTLRSVTHPEGSREARVAARLSTIARP